MSEVIASMSMSLEGFIDEDRGGRVGDLFRWYESGRTPHKMPGENRDFRISSSAKHLSGAVSESEALVTGRRLFNLTHGRGGETLGHHDADHLLRPAERVGVAAFEHVGERLGHATSKHRTAALVSARAVSNV